MRSRTPRFRNPTPTGAPIPLLVKPAEFGPHPAPNAGPRRRFLSVWYRCCNVYGRLYRNKTESAYVGCCPRCGDRVRATIGSDGTNRRMFVAQ